MGDPGRVLTREPPGTGHSAEDPRMLMPPTHLHAVEEESLCKSTGVAHELEDLCLTRKSGQEPSPL